MRLASKKYFIFLSVGVKSLKCCFGGTMNDKSAPKKRADRVEEEAKALRANLERRKKQIERRKILQKQKKDSDSGEN